MTPPLPEWAGKGDLLGLAPSTKETRTRRQRHLQGLDSKESPSPTGFLAPRLRAGAWASYTTFASRSPRARHRRRGGFRAVPAWVTSLNSAPPSDPIRESRRPRSARASGPAARPERCARAGRRRRSGPRRRQKAEKAACFVGAVASAVSAPCRAVQTPNPRRLRSDPAAPALPGRRHLCHLLSTQSRLPREGDAETGTALGWGARQDQSRAFPSPPPGPVWMPRAPVERAPPWTNPLRPRRGARHRQHREGQARARLGPLPHGP